MHKLTTSSRAHYHAIHEVKLPFILFYPFVLFCRDWVAPQKDYTFMLLDAIKFTKTEPLGWNFPQILSKMVK